MAKNDGKLFWVHASQRGESRFLVKAKGPADARNYVARKFIEVASATPATAFWAAKEGIELHDATGEPETAPAAPEGKKTGPRAA